MTERDDGRQSDAVDLVVLSGEQSARGLGLGFTHAIVGDGVEATRSWRAARNGRLYLELTSSTPPGELSSALERAAELGPGWSIVAGLADGSPVSDEARADLDAARGWRLVDVLVSDTLIAIELAADDDRPANVGLGSLVDVVGRAAVNLDRWRERVEMLERERDAVAGQAARRQEAIERLRLELADERQARQRAQAELGKARAALASSRQRIDHIERSKVMRLTRGYWRMRAKARTLRSSTRRAPTGSNEV